MEKVLVLGSNGLLGQKLTDLFFNQKEYLFVASGVGENRHPLKDKIEYHIIDIGNLSDTEKKITSINPTIVINAAAMTNVDACETEQEKCMLLNVYAVEHIAKTCAAINAHLIHISTDFIFDGTKKMYTELDAPHPLSFYGNSKLKGEEMVMKYAKKWCILRTVLVYGVVADGSRSNVVLWAKNALEKQTPIKVVNDQFRTPTLSEDLAMGCFLAAKKSAQGIYHIAGKDYMSILELVVRVASFWGLSLDNVSENTSESISQPAKRPPITGLSIEKAKNELGYEPHSFEEGLELLDKQLNSK